MSHEQFRNSHAQLAARLASYDRFTSTHFQTWGLILQGWNKNCGNSAEKACLVQSLKIGLLCTGAPGTCDTGVCCTGVAHEQHTEAHQQLLWAQLPA